MWLGTEKNYAMYHRAHEPLVRMMLFGVAGVSPKNGHAQVAREAAARQLRAASKTLAAMEAQRAPTADASAWLSTLRSKMKELIRGAQRVYDGERVPKMSRSYYANLNQRLKLRP